ncbi:MAG: leucine-rich repeat protein, partial [Bacillota bacterium]|nr:leucine-rich repeat protein [Bacillota bacterium]
RWAFLGEGELEEIIVPETVQELEREAFAGCRSLKRLYIPASVTKIGMLLLLDSEQAVIFCERDSCAHRYAEEWGYPYELIDSTDVPKLP